MLCDYKMLCCKRNPYYPRDNGPAKNSNKTMVSALIKLGDLKGKIGQIDCMFSYGPTRLHGRNQQATHHSNFLFVN
jgi:hypothetical protein